MFKSSKDDVRQTVTQVKWDKAKSQIADVSKFKEEKKDPMLQYKQLEEICYSLVILQ
jgi:hypothetical protein